MSTLYRLKAYFGMVPAEDMDAYLDYDPAYDESGYYDDPRVDPEPRRGYPEPRTEYQPPERYRPEARGPVEPAPSPVVPASTRPLGSPSGTAGHGGSAGGSSRSPFVHGALAMDSAPVEVPRPSVAPPPSVQASEPRRVPLSRITTVHPRSYNEARTIGERYRDGIPVIMNLTELDDAAAKRLVDFAAGLAFALRGSIDKVTSRVFLLSPDGVDVSAEDRRKLAEGGFFGQD
ncbi:cell division protein SepF [Pseudonocardia spinosispora]|uniref:cell division protein SepF n=1 Tax=Pseudonocardia spinosispora TaxID=103441 RepID=UPI0004915E3F|nr:cell division protein SepF [Pseudonocardia spinosispora]